LVVNSSGESGISKAVLDKLRVIRRIRFTDSGGGHITAVLEKYSPEKKLAGRGGGGGDGSRSRISLLVVIGCSDCGCRDSLCIIGMGAARQALTQIGGPGLITAPSYAALRCAVRVNCEYGTSLWSLEANIMKKIQTREVSHIFSLFSPFLFVTF